MSNKFISLLALVSVGFFYSYGVFAATLTLHPSGVAYTGGYYTGGGSWENVMDSNDGDSSFAAACCGPGGATLYMQMDDPTGIAGNTITGIDIYINARYRDGQWPGAVPYPGVLTLGYKTGTNTVWGSSVGTDTSGNYNFFHSGSFTTDSDGGTLDINDILNLELVVKRGTYGPAQLRITELYADVHYEASAVPIPSALFLFGTGLSALASAGIRKRKTSASR